MLCTTETQSLQRLLYTFPSPRPPRLGGEHSGFFAPQRRRVRRGYFILSHHPRPPRLSGEYSGCFAPQERHRVYRGFFILSHLRVLRASAVNIPDSLHHRVIHVPVGTTQRMKMIALRCQRPMTGGRSASSASSLHRVGPEYSKETRSVAPAVGKHA